MHFIRFTRTVVLAAATVLGTFACSDAGPSAPGVPGEASVVASVSVAPDSVRLAVDATHRLTLTATDSKGTRIDGASAVWTSSKPAVATVNDRGEVRAVSPGAAVIRAAVAGKVAEATVIVATAAAPVPPVAQVKSVTLSPANATLQVAQTVQLAATIKDSNGQAMTGQSITWTSSASAVATVSPNGQVVGVAAGTATIRATVAGVSGTAAVVVQAPAAPPTPPDTSSPPPTPPDTSTPPDPTTPPPAGNTACSNEPSGLSKVTDQPWNAAPPTLPAVDAAGWGLDQGRSNLVMVQDPSAPRSAPSVAAAKYTTSLEGGYEPFSIEVEFPARYTTVYQCVWIKHSANFSFSGNMSSKVGFYRGLGTNHGWRFGSHDEGGDKMFYEFFLQEGAGYRDVMTDYQAKPLGEWHRYEVLVIGNSGGNANGVMKLWVDGTLQHQETNMAYWTASQTPGFHAWAWEPTYGGGRNSPREEMFLYVDHWYISGK